MSSYELGKQLLEVASLGDTLLVKSLIANGAPFTTNWFGSSPLHMAAEHGHVDAAEILLKAGLNIDSKTKVERTPLQMAAQEGHENVVNLLIKYGADINAADMLSMSALHWAVQNNHPTLVERLLQAGADRFVANKFGKTPIDIAKEERYYKIANLLKTTLPVVESEVAVKSITYQSGSDTIHPVLGLSEAHHQQRMIGVATASARTETPRGGGGGGGIKVMTTSGPGAKQTVNTVTKAGRTITIVLTPSAPAAAAATSTAKPSGQSKQPLTPPAATRKPEESSPVPSDSEAATSSTKPPGPEGDSPRKPATQTTADKAKPASPKSSPSKSAKDTLQWLQTEGQAMLNEDGGSAAGAARTLRLTKAGEYAFEMTKQPLFSSSTRLPTATPTVDSSESESQSQDDDVGGDGGDTEGDRSPTSPTTAGARTRSSNKRLRVDSPSRTPTTATVKHATPEGGAGGRGRTTTEALSPEKIQEQLDRLQEEASAYKLALEKKQREADEYKKQLADITSGAGSVPVSPRHQHHQLGGARESTD